MRPAILVAIALAIAACGEPGVTDRYRAERELWGAEERLREFKDAGDLSNRMQWRRMAADFEAIAISVEEVPGRGLRTIEGMAWLRAAECHAAAVDSGRAEFVLATIADDFSDLPEVFGEVSFQLGRSAEVHGQIRAALHHYEHVVEFVAPDPGPDPLHPPDPDAPQEEQTADDFVLGLPLKMARMAVQDTTVTDASRFYAQASSYYEDKLDDPSPFVRVESTLLLAEIDADAGEWQRASRRLDDVAGRIPGIVMVRHEPAEARRKSFEFQTRAWVWGKTTEDSVRTLLGALMRTHPRGDTVPRALFAMSRAAAELGLDEAALADISRLLADYPTAPVAPEAQLLRAELLLREGRWQQGRQALQILPREYPTSVAAARAPLILATEYRNVGDGEGEADVLAHAEEHYRELLERYPSSKHDMMIRESLVQVLTLQKRHSAAVKELLAACEETASPDQQPGLLFEAARRTETDLQDPEGAARILDVVADEFPETRLGRRAVREAARLRRSR